MRTSHGGDGLCVWCERPANPVTGSCRVHETLAGTTRPGRHLICAGWEMTGPDNEKMVVIVAGRSVYTVTNEPSAVVPVVEAHHSVTVAEAHSVALEITSYAELDGYDITGGPTEFEADAARCEPATRTARQIVNYLLPVYEQVGASR